LAITRGVIERDGLEGYLPTLMLPASQDVIVLEGAPEGSSLPAIARRWAADRAGDEVDFLLAYKLNDHQFAVVARIAGHLHERVVLP